MFTGIIETIGTITRKEAREGAFRFGISARDITHRCKRGDSVSVNGVCQTIVEIEDEAFHFDTIEETLKKTAMGGLRQGERVNLELALRADSRLGGHFVLGHVDCVGTIDSIVAHSTERLITVRFPDGYASLVVPVGSIAIDGISLTVASVAGNTLTTAIIPHTFEHTVLNERRSGDRVNLEFDILGKYVLKMIARGEPKSKITEEWLKGLGY
jgi:riboflavin synthase